VLFVATMLVIFLGPFPLFAPQLGQLKRRSLLAYGAWWVSTGPRSTDGGNYVNMTGYACISPLFMATRRLLTMDTLTHTLT
jgi:hypothetical protein